jgi:hypothetical protein
MTSSICQAQQRLVRDTGDRGGHAHVAGGVAAAHHVPVEKIKSILISGVFVRGRDKYGLSPATQMHFTGAFVGSEARRE